MADWMFPSKAKTKCKTNLQFDHLVHVIGRIRMLLHTRWQATSGRCRRAWAQQRLQSVRPDLQLALFQLGPLSDAGVRTVVNFWSLQFLCKLGRPACICYVLFANATWAALTATGKHGSAQCGSLWQGTMNTCRKSGQ